MAFSEEGKLYIEATAKEYDGYYDEIGSHLKVKEYQITQKELFEQLEEYFDCFF